MAVIKTVTAGEVLQQLQALAPPELAESWDNIGLLVDAGAPISRILTTLDITPAVVAEAAGKGCGLIVAHHPVIFAPLKALSAGSVPGLLLKNGISAICMHTNLDAAPGGVNDTLAALLGMTDTTVFAGGCGRVGALAAPTTAAALAALCENVLGARVKYADAGKPVRRLAEVSGSGGSFWEEALAQGADCLVTGEASHHHACDALQAGLSVVVAGHWATERPIAAVLAGYLQKALPGIPAEVSARDADPYTYL
ncbi:MAG: Nif3-like dinuclear metal center hexameric protein [Gemmiger sp.]|nr:Nif3-like dinuclear metal center hexameric protein [Gemmiger sp.]